MQGAVQFIQQKIPQAVVAGQGMGSAFGGAAAAFGGGASAAAAGNFESVAFQGKQMVHLAVPPASAWSNVWTPTQNAGPTVNSTPQQIFTCGASQVSWVNVGVAQATRGQQMHGSLSIWLQNSCDSAVVPAVQTLYASAGQATTVTAVAPNAVAGSPGGGGGAAAFDPTTFLKVMELCFTPGDLQQVFKKWTAGGGTALPTPM
eukprot:gene27655-2953_t